MPAKIKLLNAAPASTTGATIEVGTGMPPVTFRTDGGYTLGGGAAGTKGVSIQGSMDGGVTWGGLMGVVGGDNITDATTAQLNDLPDKTYASVPYYPGHKVRAITGSGMVGVATVYMEFSR